MFQNKDKLIFIYVLYQIVKYLSIFFMNYFCGICIIFSCLLSLSVRLVSPADSPSPQGLFLSPVSYLSGQLVAKYKLISQRALADFARGALHAPLNPRLLNPRHGISFRFRATKPCSCYAHGMPILCPCYAHIMYYFVGMALLALQNQKYRHCIKKKVQC